MGAHPGYPDLVGFGRRNMSVSASDMHDYVLYQLGALAAFARAAGTELVHVKPHGAMYNMAAKDASLAAAVCRAVKEFDASLILLGLANSRFVSAAADAGIRFASEVFADRAYEDDGSLVARGKPGAVITDEDEAVSRVIGMVKNGTVESINGKIIELKPDSICLHGDGVKAVEFAKRIKVELNANGIETAPLAQII